MSRRILVGDLRRQVAESALAMRSFLLTGRHEYLDPLERSGRDINRTAETFMLSYAGAPDDAAATARQLRYLAGMQAGATLSVIALYESRGPAAALDLARAQASAATRWINSWRSPASSSVTSPFASVRRVRSGSASSGSRGGSRSPARSSPSSWC